MISTRARGRHGARGPRPNARAASHAGRGSKGTDLEHSATYSPEDNKLRLYPAHRLDSETYARIKAAGFSWAPKQELFVAPAWSPHREDLLLELAGKIGDEDTSLVDRAEQRAERFEDYGAARHRDADRAYAAVKSIADNIPLGQPILVGHHSEEHARRDAEKIQNGMSRAVKMWETAQYWQHRAAGAISNAKYKERPAVRARRIKTLEAEERKILRERAEAAGWLKRWTAEGLTHERAVELANYSHLNMPAKPGQTWGDSVWSLLSQTPPAITVAEAVEQARRAFTRTPEDHDRWLCHLRNRLIYERAMLADSGGLVSDRHELRPGGRVLRRGEWFVVLKVNPQSVTVSGHFATTIPFDEIQDYREATDEAAAAVRKVMKLPPLCNYPGEGFKHMTKAELAAEKCRQWSDFPKTGRMKATDKHGAHRVQQTRGAGPFSVVGVYVTDQKRTDPPPPPTEPRPDLKPQKEPREPRAYTPPAPTVFDAMKDTLRAGVQVVSAPQLFPTPIELAGRLVELADIGPDHRVLEPSAGTGRLINAISGKGGELVAVEIHHGMAESIRRNWQGIDVRCADFLTCHGDLGTFDRIIMNPPFERGSDIEHIEHARRFLRPGGRLVAICANGPRQRERLQPIAAEWIDLEPGSFKESGANVNAAIVVIDA